MRDSGTRLDPLFRSGSKRERIYVDLDDVLCRTIESFVHLVNGEFGKSVDFESVTSFDLQRSFGLDDAEYKRFWGLSHSREQLLAIPPLTGALATVANWFKLGYRISIATGRPPKTRSVSEEWLGRYRFPYDDLIYVDKYDRLGPWSVDSDFMPLDQLKEAPFQLAIEDELSTATRLAQQDSVRSVAVLDWPWNRTLGEEGGRWPRKLTRCRDWAEIRRVFPRP